ncbi:MAG: TetR/AcrR family transcriptional regulator [Myxococcales bacterium]|nr:TetR/AcrR family transcriptional regulator [Myxococcales bacterium]
MRAALITAAIELIAENGVAGLSLRECARRAGVSHAAPYRHFADKNALLLEIARDGFARLAAVGEAAMKAVEDPRDRLDAYGIAYVRFAVENPVVFRLMFTSDFDKGEGQDDDADPGAFALLLRTAGDAVGGKVDARLAAAGAWSLPHGLALLILDGRIPKEEAGTPEQAEALARSIFALWRGPLGR